MTPDIGISSFLVLFFEVQVEGRFATGVLSDDELLYLTVSPLVGMLLHVLPPKNKNIQSKCIKVIGDAG